MVKGILKAGHLSWVHDGFFWTLFANPMRSCAFAMHLNQPLSDIICLSCVFLWILYGLKSSFCGYWRILYVLYVPNSPLSYILFSCDFVISESLCSNQKCFVASNWSVLDASYIYKLALECRIISVVSLQISTWMPYFFYRKSSNWHFNAIFIGS